MEDKKLKEFPQKWKYLILSIVFNFVVPFATLMYQFKFFEKQTSNAVRITLVGTLILSILLFKFGSWINNFVKNCKNFFVACCLSSAKIVFFGVVFVLALELMKTKIDDLEFICVVFSISWFIGNIYFRLYERQQILDEKQQTKNDMSQIVREELENFNKDTKN